MASKCSLRVHDRPGGGFCLPFALFAGERKVGCPLNITPRILLILTGKEKRLTVPWERFRSHRTLVYFLAQWASLCFFSNPSFPGATLTHSDRSCLTPLPSACLSDNLIPSLPFLLPPPLSTSHLCDENQFQNNQIRCQMRCAQPSFISAIPNR